MRCGVCLLLLPTTDTQVVGDASLGTCRVSHLAMLRMFDQHWGRVKSAEGQASLHESL